MDQSCALSCSPCGGIGRGRSVENAGQVTKTLEAELMKLALTQGTTTKVRSGQKFPLRTSLALGASIGSLVPYAARQVQKGKRSCMRHWSDRSAEGFARWVRACGHSMCL